jgi:hypothetical protein
MATYQIYFTQTASTVVNVEADDFEEAIELAYNKLPAGLCAQCSGWGRGPAIDLSGEWEPDEKFYYRDGEAVTA